MEKNLNRVTYESIKQNELEDKFDDLSHNLVNTEYWKNPDFHKIYFQRKLKFSADENILKEEYSTWHKELGLKFYDPNKKKFITDDLPWMERVKLPKYMFKYMLMHPMLTYKDRNYLISIEKTLINELIKVQLFNSFCGLFVLGFIFRKLAYISKKSLREVVKKNYLFSFIILFSSCIIIDSTQRMKKHKDIINFFHKGDLVDNYLQNYLKN